MKTGGQLIVDCLEANGASHAYLVPGESFLAVLVAAAALASIPPVIYESVNGHAIWPTTMRGLTVSIYAALLPSILAQQFFIRGVEMLGANIAGLYINLVPVFGAILAVVLLSERFSTHQAMALMLVIGGILIAQGVVTKLLRRSNL